MYPLNYTLYNEQLYGQRYLTKHPGTDIYTRRMAFLTTSQQCRPNNKLIQQLSLKDSMVDAVPDL